MNQKKYWGKRLFPFIRQTSTSECGTTSLAMVLKYYGAKDLRNLLNNWAQLNREGVSVLMLKQLAEKFGFEANGFKGPYETLSRIKLPAIVHYDGNHFVVVYEYHEEYLRIADPALGRIKISKVRFAQKWKGIILELKPTHRLFKNPEIETALKAMRFKKQAILQHFFRAAWSTVRSKMFYMLLISALLALLGLVQPVLLQWLIDEVLPGRQMHFLYAILSILLVFFILEIFFRFLGDRILSRFKSRFEIGFFSRYFRHFLHLEQSYFNRYKREELIANFQQNLGLRRLLSSSMVQHIINVPVSLCYLLILAYYSKILMLVALCLIVVYALILWKKTPQLISLGRKTFKENSRSLYRALDIVLGMENIKLLSAETAVLSSWQKQYEASVEQSVGTAKKYAMLNNGLRLLHTLCILTVFWLGAYFVIRDKLTLGAYIAFLLIFRMLMEKALGITGAYIQLTGLKVLFHKLYDIFSQPVEAEDKSKAGIKPLNITSINFKEVSFSYRPGISPEVLRNINLEIKQGEFVGIVGRNGSGKTTLVKLLTQLYKGYKGSISIGKTDLLSVNPSILREKVFMIPQEVVLFSGTLRENIVYGLEDIPDEALERAVLLADLQDVVKQHYLGYDLRIGTGGTQLSGGEKLKIAFARLFLRKPEVIVLDEASSALDPEAEARIMEHVRQSFPNKTMISIAHRINTLKKADKIVVMDRGKIAETGAHEELMRRKKLYFKLVQSYINL